jgi:two-component system NtrC family sensor kinase
MIAHEVKNPLGVILSGAEFLEVKLPRYDAEVTSTLEKIKDASLRANFVLQALLQFARPSEFKVEQVKPETIIKPIVDLMMHRARFAGITINSEIGNEPATVPVDGNQIQQVFINVILNAAEAMTSGGKLTIASAGTINFSSGVSIGTGEFNYNSATALSKSVSFSGAGGILSGTGTITPAVTVAAGNTLSTA